jgi:hypothetical protein
MTKHYNPSLVERTNRIFRPKAGDQFSDNVSPNLVPVITVDPIVRIVRNGNTSSTGTFTVYTTPSDKDFYLTAIELTMAKDVTCDAATGSVGMNITVDGVSVAVVTIAFITLTAQTSTVVVPFTFPIKVDRGTTITGSVTFTAGAMRRSCCIYGYTEEVTAS